MNAQFIILNANRYLSRLVLSDSTSTALPPANASNRICQRSPLKVIDLEVHQDLSTADMYCSKQSNLSGVCRITNDEFRIKTCEFCMTNDETCTKMMNFVQDKVWWELPVSLTVMHLLMLHLK